MIHLFKKFGLNIVLDVASGSILTVDDLAYEVLDYYNTNNTFEGIYQKLTLYSKSDIDETIKEIEELIEQEVLFYKDQYQEYDLIEKRNPVVKALCLHVSHDCDLRCRYCFASTGSFKGNRKLMNLEVGKKAIDFLLENSGNRRNLEVDFFGGEPLLNLDVVKGIIEYAREVEAKYNKKISFTLTTNATMLSEEVMEFLNENMENIVLSHDGRKNVNDYMRIDIDGKGTYENITNNILKFINKRKGKTYYVRGTFTANNLDFSEDVLHLADLGIKEISVEPVVLPDNSPYAIKEEHLEKLKSEYDRLAERYLERNLSGNGFNFFHFNIDLTGGPCVSKRLAGCGAGFEYMAVDPDGNLFPCHQFVDKAEFKIGTVFSGIENHQTVEKFKKNTVFTKDECSNCWAKYYCSGGCAAANYNMNGNVKKSYSVACELEKKRLECAIALKLKLEDNKDE
ncbi:thioether cross-link-forming SCIFF peptide maturase [Caldicellulosiruptoraceae bacterium PP1]